MLDQAKERVRCRAKERVQISHQQVLQLEEAVRSAGSGYSSSHAQQAVPTSGTRPSAWLDAQPHHPQARSNLQERQRESPAKRNTYTWEHSTGIPAHTAAKDSLHL